MIRLNIKQIILDFWQDVANQDPKNLKRYFSSKSIINWHNTNEQFSAEEYIRANCEYPGDWCGKVERIEFVGSLVITVTRIWPSDNSASFHVTSFFEFSDDKIIKLDEYWGDNGLPPKWRLDKKIGKSIR